MIVDHRASTGRAYAPSVRVASSKNAWIIFSIIAQTQINLHPQSPFYHSPCPQQCHRLKEIFPTAQKHSPDSTKRFSFQLEALLLSASILTIRSATSWASSMSWVTKMPAKPNSPYIRRMSWASRRRNGLPFPEAHQSSATHRQAATRRSREQEALAGLVEGRQMAGRPVRGKRCLLYSWWAFWPLV